MRPSASGPPRPDNGARGSAHDNPTLPDTEGEDEDAAIPEIQEVPLQQPPPSKKPSHRYVPDPKRVPRGPPPKLEPALPISSPPSSSSPSPGEARRRRLRNEVLLIEDDDWHNYNRTEADREFFRHLLAGALPKKPPEYGFWDEVNKRNRHQRFEAAKAQGKANPEGRH